jgi:hypothetical protein
MRRLLLIAPRRLPPRLWLARTTVADIIAVTRRRPTNPLRPKAARLLLPLRLKVARLHRLPLRHLQLRNVC